jgi:two-component system C4-dicarboxylate transport sensor histidine kinase DctB
MADLRARGIEALSLKSRSVVSEIERLRYLPFVLAQDERIQQLLDRGGGAALAGRANLYLETVNRSAGADELYVMNREGLTLAASNWREETSFVGHSYAFRPYFKDAMAKGEGRYYAVGVTTGVPGYFLAHRIETPSGTLGVAVVKIDLAPLESTWHGAGDAAGLVDGAGIVFLSSVPEWKYRPLRRLSPQDRTRILETRQFDPGAIDLPPLLGAAGDADGSDLFVPVAGNTMLMQMVEVPSEGWRIIAASDIAPVQWIANLVAAIVFLAAALLFALGFYLRERQHRIRVKLGAHDALERRVEERTHELADANRTLAQEIEERRRAQDHLQLAQDELIQAAKLAALGQMSAAIVHEVSQPVGAMENYLAATGVLAARGDVEAVRGNVEIARDLLRRMQRTIQHLKSFARKEKGQLEQVDVAQVLAAAVELVQHRTKRLGVEVALNLPPTLSPVRASPVRLEQVLVNLLSNALDAVETTQAPRIEIDAREADGVLRIEVADNGCGFSAENAHRLTEPFFTTKRTGEGLGLGLSISRAIIEDLGGSLQARAGAVSGSVFSIAIPAMEARPMRVAE